MNELTRYSHSRVNETPLSFSRALLKEIDWDHRLNGITGARGIGKTTLMLQFIKQKYQTDGQALYVSLDHLYFLKNSLLSFTEDFYINGGRHLFLDEVHRYPNWSMEVKNIYDTFTRLKIVFSGSSALQIHKAEADLSRRTAMYNLRTMSLREYIELSRGLQIKPVSLNDILENHVELAGEIAGLIKPIPVFKEYLQGGAYPFYVESATKFPDRLLSAIHVILEMDIPAVEKVNYSSIVSLKRILAFIADSVPYKPNISELSRKSGVARDVLLKMIGLLERSGILLLLRQSSEPTGYLTKPEKIYLDNTALLYALSPGREPETGTLRETFFANQLMNNHQLTIPDKGDFLIDNEYIFEIGGKNKTSRQIKNTDKAFVAADDIETGYRNVIPLWLFGFLY